MSQISLRVIYIFLYLVIIGDYTIVTYFSYRSLNSMS